jgi:hypothetical protein
MFTDNFSTIPRGAMGGSVFCVYIITILLRLF